MVSTTYKILSNVLLPRLTPYVDVIINIGFYVTDQLVIRYSVLGKNWRKKQEYNGDTHRNL